MTKNKTTYTAEQIPPGSLVEIHEEVGLPWDAQGNYLRPGQRLTRVTVKTVWETAYGVMLEFVGQSSHRETNSKWVKSVLRKGPEP